MNQRIAAASSQTVQLVEQFSRQQGEELALLAKQVAAIFAGGGQLLIAAPGAMQPLAQLLASHFTYRLGFERPVLPAVALGSDPVLSAAMSGSAQHNQLLVRHYRALSDRQQLLLLLNDGNDNQALRILCEEVLEKGQVLAMLTPDRQTDPLCSDGMGSCLSLGTSSLPRLLELTLFAVDLLCELVEAELFSI